MKITFHRSQVTRTALTKVWLPPALSKALVGAKALPTLMAARLFARVPATALAAHRAALRAPVSARRFATESGIAASKDGAQSSAITASAPAAKAIPPPAVPKRGSSLVDRFWAFLVGVGTGGIGFYYKLSEDIVESTAEVTLPNRSRVISSRYRCAAPPLTLVSRDTQIDTRIVGLRADVANANEALRRRIATLEHQVQELSDRLEK